METQCIRKGVIAVVLSAGLVVRAVAPASAGEVNGRWVAGDFHTHTWLTDGNRSQEEVALHAFSYGLDWFANSEHGGTSGHDPGGKPFPAPIPRWITLKYFSFPIVQRLRVAFPHKGILQGVEWSVPAHEHASVGIVVDDPTAISDFEYACDAGDHDTSRALAKRNRTHDDAVACAAMLESNYGGTSYLLPGHPSRAGKYTVADLRDFNNAAPDVAFGFEGIPGHQKSPSRGGTIPLSRIPLQPSRPGRTAAPTTWPRRSAVRGMPFWARGVDSSSLRTRTSTTQTGASGPVSTPGRTPS